MYRIKEIEQKLQWLEKKKKPKLPNLHLWHNYVYICYYICYNYEANRYVRREQEIEKHAGNSELSPELWESSTFISCVLHFKDVVFFLHFCHYYFCLGFLILHAGSVCFAEFNLACHIKSVISLHRLEGAYLIISLRFRDERMK